MTVQGLNYTHGFEFLGELLLVLFGIVLFFAWVCIVAGEDPLSSENWVPHWAILPARAISAAMLILFLVYLFLQAARQ